MTHIFGQKPLEDQIEDDPVKDLDIVLSVAGLWIGELYDTIIQIDKAGFVIAEVTDAGRSVALKITPHAPLLFRGESDIHKALEEMDDV